MLKHPNIEPIGRLGVGVTAKLAQSRIDPGCVLSGVRGQFVAPCVRGFASSKIS
jgi:hypothetical protein